MGIHSSHWLKNSELGNQIQGWRWTHISIYTYISLRMRTNLYIHIHIYILVYLHIYTLTCIYACINQTMGCYNVFPWRSTTKIRKDRSIIESTEWNWWKSVWGRLLIRMRDWCSQEVVLKWGEETGDIKWEGWYMSWLCF